MDTLNQFVGWTKVLKDIATNKPKLYEQERVWRTSMANEL
jgi:hypothetical protein